MIKNDEFWKDGQPFRIIGGDLHYFRIHPEVLLFKFCNLICYIFYDIFYCVLCIFFLMLATWKRINELCIIVSHCLSFLNLMHISSYSSLL